MNLRTRPAPSNVVHATIAVAAYAWLLYGCAPLDSQYDEGAARSDLSSATFDERAYFAGRPIDPTIGSTGPYSVGDPELLSDGNVNGQYEDPAVSVGYLDGPELGVFYWDDTDNDKDDDSTSDYDTAGATTTTADCDPLASTCANIATSDGHWTEDRITRPLWGTTFRGQHIASVYYTLRDAAREYFDAFNTIGTTIANVSNTDEPVVLLNRPDSVGCSGSCMRPAYLTDPSYRVFAESRPDGRNGGVSYNDRPKIFLSGSEPSSSWSAKVPVHEFGHYYNRVFVPNYGNGGGFNFISTCYHSGWEEQALDEGLGYWYSSDYLDREELGRAPNGTRPRYSDYPWTGDCSPESGDPYDANNQDDDWDAHELGDVITSALWEARASSGCDVEGWRQSIFAVVDSIPAENMGDSDPFGGGSILRGFAALVLAAAQERRACSTNAAETVAKIFVAQELLPPYLDQYSTGSSNEAGDAFGAALARGDFNGDGLDDLAIGIPEEDQDGAADSGMVHVLYGDAAGFLTGEVTDYERIDQHTAGSTLETDDRFGAALTTGDINGDGYDDLGVGAPGETIDGRESAGFVTVFYGSSTGLISGSYARLDQSFAGSSSEAGDAFGSALAIGDFNHDGYGDLAVGSPGEDQDDASDSGLVTIRWGSRWGVCSSRVEKLDQGSFGSTNEDDDRFGASLVAADFSGDQYDDLAIGLPGETTNGKTEAGFLMVAYGSTDALLDGTGVVRSSKINAESLGSTSEEGDRFATALAAGDFNRDGYADLAIAAPFEEEISGIDDSGFVFVIPGSRNGLRTSGVEKMNQETGGSASEDGDNFGLSLGAGDVDGDGYVDLAVGIPYEDSDDTGFAHLYYGSSQGLVPATSSRYDATSFASETQDDELFGSSLALGDFDGDGAAELAISAPGRNDGAGAVFVVNP